MFTAGIGSTTIDMFGDSLTQGAGSTGGQTRQYWIRRRFPERVVREHGIGGIGIAHVAAIQGGSPSKVTPSGALTFTTPISATLTVNLGATAADTSDRYFSGQLDGQSVMIKRTGATDAMTISSTVGGTPTIAAASSFIPDAAWNARSSIQSICAGTNDRGVTSQDVVAAHLVAMIEFVDAPRRVLVHGVHADRADSGATRTWVDQVNAAREALYAGQAETEFISWEPPTVAEMTVVGYSPSGADNTDIANGLWPAGLTSDGLHLTSTGYRIIANREIAALLDRNW